MRWGIGCKKLKCATTSPRLLPRGLQYPRPTTDIFHRMSTPEKPIDYRRKIMTREQLRAAIGPRPRSHSVIMCHGTFDHVHPGHIRHLM